MMHFSEIFKGHQHAVFDFLRHIEVPVRASKRPVNVAGGYAQQDPATFIAWHVTWVQRGYAHLPYFAELAAKRLKGIK